MKKIKYKKLSIQNFLSIGNDTVEIDFQSGLNLITGSNIDNPERKNAVGKSALIEAFYYSLFGTTIRDIKKEFVINNVTKGKGKIDLFFDVQTDTGTNSYRITRTLKPSAVELYKLGTTEEDISKDSISNTNKYICELIGSNPVICKSCDILSLSDNTPFMAKKPEEKRKFIEDIFTLEIFGKMLKDLKELVKDNKSNISITSAKISEISNSIVTLTNQYDAQKKKNEEREQILANRRLDILSNIDQIKGKILNVVVEPYDNSEVLKYTNALKQVDSKIKDISERLLINRSTIKNLKVEESNISNVSVGVECSYCHQEIPHTHEYVLNDLKTMISNQLLELSTDNENLNNDKISWETKKKKIQNKLDKFDEVFHSNQQKTFQISSYNSDIKNLELNLTRLDEDLADTSGSLDLFISNIEETKNRQVEQQNNLDNLNQESADLDICKFILGEEGIKSFIIKRLLDMLNSSIQKYINILGMTMKCKFDEYFDEKITNDKGKDISYWNFSGGERRTVDLACAWAFKDIKKKISGISSNVEFLDEILDGAFDSVGLDKLIECIKDRVQKNNLACYSISHRNETLKHITGETVNLVKENGLTKRII